MNGTSQSPMASPPGSPWPLAGAPIYWINLDRRQDRRAQMEERLAGWIGPVERIPAIDGQAIPPERLAPWLAKRRNRERIFNIPAELGCTMSHIRAVEMALERGIFPAMVFEDDAVPTVRWWQQQLPDGWRVAMLGGFLDRTSDPVRPVDGWADLHGIHWLGAYAYAISSPETARRLLERWTTFDHTLDVMLWSFFPPGEWFGAVPPLVDLDFASHSDIFLLTRNEADHAIRTVADDR